MNIKINLVTVGLTTYKFKKMQSLFYKSWKIGKTFTLKVVLHKRYNSFAETACSYSGF